MAKDAGWGRRLRSARRAYVEDHDTALTYEEIGKRVGALLGRPAFKHPTVRAWFVDGQEPDSLEVIRTLAAVLDADVGYLIEGDKTAPSDEAEGADVRVGAVALTVQEKAAAVEEAAAIRAARAAAPKGKKRSAKKPSGKAAAKRGAAPGPVRRAGRSTDQ